MKEKLYIPAMSFAEIARELKISNQAVEETYYRALAKLRKKYACNV